MIKDIKIVTFAGSTRQNSFNKKLARIASNLCSETGLHTTYIDLKFYPMPLYDGDLEEEIIAPEHALKLREILQSNHGFIIACPEYNSSISGVLKNMIDWCSRPLLNEEPLGCFKNKIVALVSASPGRLGGLRGLSHVRSILSNLGSLVIPEQFALPHAHEKISEDGYLENDTDQEQMQLVVEAFVERVRKLAV